MSEPTDVTPADFAFDDWIAGATISKQSVPIYSKPGLYAEYQELERALKQAEALEEDGTELGGRESTRIITRMRALYDEWQDSKSNWTVRALSIDEIDSLDTMEGHEPLAAPPEPPRPVAPAPLPEKHTEQQGRSHTVATQKHEAAMKDYAAELRDYVKARRVYDREQNLRAISLAVERIEFANGRTLDGVTVEQLRKMRGALGDLQLNALVNATRLASQQEPEIPAPFYRSTSENDPT